MQSVLVTGAGGSIGSALCERLIQEGVKRLTLVSLTESGLYNVERKLRALGTETELVSILGSVCDRSLMLEVCEGVDVVIHAAAHKHLPICESNPIAAIENNVRGTLCITTAVQMAGVNQFVLISTDKAVRPVSVMGATKRVAELIVSAWAAKSEHTQFMTVRFGNVMDSAGSVIPLWREQIANGGPITLTDERCERYFMSIAQACELILGVVKIGKKGTFVFDMGKPQKLIDLAQRMIQNSGTQCAIKCIGLRPGEKLTEELDFGGERRKTDHEKIFMIDEAASGDWRRTLLDDLLHASKSRNKDRATEILRSMTC